MRGRAREGEIDPHGSWGGGVARRKAQGAPGSRRWPGARVRAAGTRPPAHWQEVEDDREVEVGWAGFARLGCYSGGLHGKVPLFFLFPVFYYSATLWLY